MDTLSNLFMDTLSLIFYNKTTNNSNSTNNSNNTNSTNITNNTNSSNSSSEQGKTTIINKTHKVQSIKNNIISQCLNFLSLENELLKSQLIDPLLKYLRRQIQIFVLIFIILIIILIILNIVILYKVL